MSCLVLISQLEYWTVIHQRAFYVLPARYPIYPDFTPFYYIVNCVLTELCFFGLFFNYSHFEHNSSRKTNKQTNKNLLNSGQVFRKTTTTKIEKYIQFFQTLSPRLDFDSSFHSISDVLTTTVWTISQHTAAPWRLHSHTAARNCLDGFTTNELG